MIRETLEAARAQLIASLAVLDVALAEIDRGQPQGCQHPKKADVSTMGNPGAWYCPDCKQQGQT